MREAQIMTQSVNSSQRGLVMESNQLIILSKAFAVDIISLCESLRERKKATAIINQLLRSGTSIGANIHEANYASSKADFINKFQIALKECYETEYWLELLGETDYITDKASESLLNDCRELIRLITSIVKTTKENNQLTLNEIMNYEF